jgi:diaminohydroxyphosphoribosylaminopyrimidine deaminase/5-amino-6-(5-phosphoribosylamino)uracil reductase
LTGNLKDEQANHVRYVKLDFDQELQPQLFQKLTELNIQSLLVEGGTETLNKFIEKECWDEALVFQNPDLYFKQGVKGPEFALKNTFELVGDDKLFHHFKNETLPAKGALAQEVF